MALEISCQPEVPEFYCVSKCLLFNLVTAGCQKIESEDAIFYNP